MSRQYTHLQELLPSVLAMKGEGCTLREIANHFGLTKEQIKGLCKRARRKERLQKVIFQSRKVVQERCRLPKRNRSNLEFVNWKCKWSFFKIFYQNVEGCESQIQSY